MVAKHSSWLAFVALAAVCLVGFQTAQAGSSVHYNTFLDSTDYSDAGLDLGNLGYQFYNWDQTTPTTGDLPQENWNSALPSWLTLDLTQGGDTAAFGDQVTSSGGQATWNDLTDPVGNTALSGSLVDPQSNDNSNNTIRQFEFTAGFPSKFLWSLVVDNTNGEYNPDNKLRPRLDSAGDTNVVIGHSGFNGTADVYQFLIEYPGWVGDWLKVQLRTTDPDGEGPLASTDGGIAGMMFDSVAGLEDADFNQDGDVDGADFLALQRGFGTTGTALLAQGDANFDGNVTAADLTIWQNQYGGSGLVTATVNVVPEPNTLMLLGGLALGLAIRRRRG